jgi:hypothetical protein
MNPSALALESESAQEFFPLDGSLLGATPEERHDKVDILEAVIAMSNSSDDAEEELSHHFTPGIYLRELSLGKGAVFTSIIHQTTHPLIILKGKCLVYTPEDGETKEYSAPAVILTQPNTRRVGFVIEDCTWLTVHATELTNPEEIMEKISTQRDNPYMPEGYLARAYNQQRELE